MMRLRSFVARFLVAVSMIGIASLGRGKMPSPEPSDGEPAPAAPKQFNPAVAALLATEASTNGDLVWSAVTLFELGQPELAKARLKRVLDADLSDEATVDLARQIGSAMLVQLAGIDALAPEGQQLSLKLVEALNRRARDPQRLAQRARDLTDPSPAVRTAAVNDLKMGGSDSVLLLIQLLAGDPSSADKTAIVDALGSMGPDVAEVVVAALSTEDSALRTKLLEVCCLLEDQASEVVPYLLASAVAAADPAERQAARGALRDFFGELPDRRQATQLLESHVRGYLSNAFPLPEDETGQVTIWRWDDREKGGAPHAYRAEQGSLLLAARLARELARVGDTDRMQRLILLAWLEAAAVDEVAGQTYGPLVDRLTPKLGVRDLERLLQEAIEGDHMEAAIEAARMLGAAGAKEAVVGGRSRPTPLVRAIRSGDRRLMFAALGSVIELDPPPFYFGASTIPDALEFLTSSTGRRLALIADRRPTDARRMAALLVGLGYNAQSVHGGRQLLAAARQSADVQLILLRDPIDRTTTRETLYRLRRDWRTSRIPVAIVAAADRIGAAHDLAASYAVTEAFVPPHDRAAMEVLAGRMNDLAGPSLLDDRQRHAQANEALRWLAALAARPAPGYQLGRPIARAETMLFVPGHAVEAIAVLALAGTASSQQRLIDLASRTIAPVEQRQQALAALKRSIHQFGTLLTSKEILRQYDRYNASEHADAERQAILAAILDLLEDAGTSARVGPDR
ncbi:MAG: hypothetical protein ACC645_03850 [Pirellulales bacterium]